MAPFSGSIVANKPAMSCDTGAEIFIDSDHLQGSDVLFDAVRSDVQNPVILLAGETATAGSKEQDARHIKELLCTAASARFCNREPGQGCAHDR